MKTRIRNFIKEIKTPDKVLIILLVASIILPKYYSITNKLFVEPLGIDQMKSNVVLDVVFGCILGFAIVFLINKCYNSKFPTAKSLIVSAIVFVWYMGMYRCNTEVYLSSFSKLATFLKYTDVLLFSLFIFVSKYVYKPRQKLVADESQAFIEDRFSGKTEHDLLGRTGLAAQVVYSILATPQLEESLVIGINAPWGYGKTAFMKLMQSLLTKPGELKKYKTIADNNNETSVINNKVRLVEYSLWKNLDNKLLVEDFLETISEQIEEYDDSLAKDILKYAKSVSKVVGGGTDTLMEEIYSLFNKPQSLKKQFDHINNTLEKLEKKLVIFIDDLDRLNGDELVEVFKLIRNTANFKNVFFVVAYDYNYVLNAIGKQLQIENKEEYLRKIIQVDVLLSKSRELMVEKKLVELLKNYVREKDLERIKKEILENLTMISSDFNSQMTFQNKLEGIFPNIREIHKFINSFLLTYNIASDKLDVRDLFLLEIIKIRYNRVYQSLENRSLIMQSLEKEPDKVNTKSQTILSQEDYNIYSQAEKHLIYEIIQYLFWLNNRKNRVIASPIYYRYYFNYNFPIKLSLNDLEDNIGKILIRPFSPQDYTNICRYIDDNSDIVRIKDVWEFVKNINAYTVPSVLEWQLRLCFYFAKYKKQLDYFTIRKETISTVEFIRHMDSLGSGEISKMLQALFDMLKNKDYDAILRIDISFSIYSRVSIDDGYLEKLKSHLDVKKLLATIPNAYEQLLKELEGFNGIENYTLQNLFEMYRNVYSLRKKEDTKEIYDSVNKIMLENIREYTGSYLKNYILRMDEEKKQYFFDPFLDDYLIGEGIDKKAHYLEIFKNKQVSEELDTDKEYYNFIVTAFDTYGFGKNFSIDDEQRSLIKERFFKP